MTTRLKSGGAFPAAYIFIERGLCGIYVLSRRYFWRAWILQEVILPRKLVFLFGFHVITPEEILSGIDSLNHYPLLGFVQGFTDLLLAVLGGSVKRTRNLLEEHNKFDLMKKWQMEQYIITCRGYEASDPRDLIFAGLGLFNHKRLIISDFKHENTDYDIPIKLWTEFRNAGARESMQGYAHAGALPL